jgi:hypothetical protein
METSHAGPPADRFRTRAWLVVLGAVSILSLAASLARHLVQVASPLEFDFAEGFVVSQAMTLESVASLYPALDPAAPRISPYPPLFQLATRAVNSLTQEPFVAGRLVSSIAAIAVALMAAALVHWAVPHRIGIRERAAGALVGASLCFLVPAMLLAPHARPDLLGVSLSFAGLFVFLRGRDAVLTDLLSSLFLVASVFTKQTLIDAPLALLITAFLMRPLRAVRIGSLLLALGGAILLSLTYETNGEVLRHLFVYPNTSFSIRRSLTLMGNNVLTIAVPASAAFWLFIWALQPRDGRRRRYFRRLRSSLLSSHSHRLVFTVGLYMLIGWAMGFTIGKEGSNLNYLMSWNLCTALLSGVAVSYAAGPFPANAGAGRLLIVGLLLFTSVGCLEALRGLDYWGGMTPLARASLEQRVGRSKELEEAIRGMRGDVISEDMSAVVRAGKSVLFEPFIVGEQMKMGRIPESPLIERIERREFGGLVLDRGFRPPRFPREFLAAVDRHYVQSQQIGAFSVYVPKSN